MSGLATRGEAFRLVADGVAAGLSAPWRLYLARGCRYLSMSVGERAEWDAWRSHLGCPVMTVRVYDVAGDIRRASVAEAVIDGCRISVELVEDVSTGDLATGLGMLGGAADGATDSAAGKVFDRAPDRLLDPDPERPLDPAAEPPLPPPSGARPIIPTQFRDDERGGPPG